MKILLQFLDFLSLKIFFCSEQIEEFLENLIFLTILEFLIIQYSNRYVKNSIANLKNCRISFSKNWRSFSMTKSSVLRSLSEETLFTFQIVYLQPNLPQMSHQNFISTFNNTKKIIKFLLHKKINLRIINPIKKLSIKKVHHCSEFSFWRISISYFDTF